MKKVEQGKKMQSGRESIGVVGCFIAEKEEKVAHIQKIEINSATFF